MNLRDYIMAAANAGSYNGSMNLAEFLIHCAELTHQSNRYMSHRNILLVCLPNVNKQINRDTYQESLYVCTTFQGLSCMLVTD